MKTGEKQMVIYRQKPFTPCTRIHYDNVPVRVSDLDVDLSRPPHKEKTGWIRTGDVS